MHFTFDAASYAPQALSPQKLHPPKFAYAIQTFYQTLYILLQYHCHSSTL